MDLKNKRKLLLEGFMHLLIHMAFIAGILVGNITEPATSVKRLAKMSQERKDNLLLFYASKTYPKPQVYTLRGLWRCRPTFPIFEPAQMYLDKILDLIKHGASVNMDIPYYWTHKVSGNGTFKPIYLFIKSNNIKATRLLLEYGATVDVVIRSRQCASGYQYEGFALDFAATQEMAELLMSYGASKG